MVRSLSNWEYRRLLGEAQPLVGQRFEKAYELGHGLFRLDFGKHSLMVNLGSCLYLSSNPPPGPQSPTSMAMQMRKHLDSQRLVSFSPYRPDRIYVLEFISGWKIILEQFAGGNLFLLDETGQIVRPYHFKPTSSRSYRAGSSYVWPDSPDFELPPAIYAWKSTQQAVPSAKLEVALSRWPIGKIYTLEAIALSGLDGKTKISDVADAQAKILLSSLEKLLSKPTPLVYEKKDSPGLPVELSLAPLSAYPTSDFISKSFDSWSEAVEYYFTHAHAPAEQKESPEVLKLRHRLAEQEAALTKLEKEIGAAEPPAQWLEHHLSAVEARLHELQSSGASAPPPAGEKIDWKNKKLKLETEE